MSMERRGEGAQPNVKNLDVLAYELNALAHRIAAETQALSRQGLEPRHRHGEEVADQMNEIIAHLRQVARTLAYTRRAGDVTLRR